MHIVLRCCCGLGDCSGVDVWPLLTGANATQPRPLTPVTEVSIVDTSDHTRWWKLITLAGQSGYYTTNSTQVRKPPLFGPPFIYINDHFTKTGSGQT
jgi:hypothetical protein